MLRLFGGDENYLLLNGFTLADGRNINRTEVQSGSNVCLLGYDVAKKLFREGIEKAVNAMVRVNNIPYRVLVCWKAGAPLLVSAGIMWS